MVYSATIHVETNGFSDIHDLTREVVKAAAQSGIICGVAVIFVPGSTAGITTIEFESGAVHDLKQALERLAPMADTYEHNRRWGDGNGFSHVRAALLGPSLSAPIQNGQLVLGTWQQIILVDFDNRPRNRDVLVQLVGD